MKVYHANLKIISCKKKLKLAMSQSKRKPIIKFYFNSCTINVFLENLE